MGNTLTHFYMGPPKTYIKRRPATIGKLAHLGSGQSGIFYLFYNYSKYEFSSVKDGAKLGQYKFTLRLNNNFYITLSLC